jgi:hypothetical protein
MSKITRDAFLYLEPKTSAQKQDFAQCGPCRMFVPESYLDGKLIGDRCIIHGSLIAIDADDSCGFFVPWPNPDKPNSEVMRDHAEELLKMIPGSVTPEESGLVDRKVQCHRCRFANAKVDVCGLYDGLNDSFPDVFDLKTEILKNACCNAQEPKISSAEYDKMNNAERIAYARSSSVRTRMT